jgi:heptose-I-phosphate ethanolaminephosphotransferase
MLSAWDNKVALIAQEANRVVAINKKVGIYKQPTHYDEALLEPFQRSLDSPGEKLIVIHLMGNHSSYCKRYPEEWQKFSKDLQIRRFGRPRETTNTDKINCYDNRIVYNDFILDSIFELLEESALSASVFYFADHSDDIFGGKAHNQANFNFSMSEIPTFIWATEKWKLENSMLWNQLFLHKDTVFTNDLCLIPYSG